MINYERIADRIFKVLKGNGYQIKLYSGDGDVTVNPAKADRFYVHEPNMIVALDRIDGQIILNKNASVLLSVYEGVLHQLRNIANHYMLTFTMREFGKDIKPKDFSYQAKNKGSEMNEGKGNTILKQTKCSSDENVLESKLSKMFGSKKTSKQTLENVRILVKHKAEVDEQVRGSRSRNIQSIFLECNGERVRLQHNHLGGARAMARHLAMGGTTTDQIGEHITTSTGNYLKLREFARYAASNKLINEDVGDIMSLITEQLSSIQKNLKKIAGYNTYTVETSKIGDTALCEISDSSITDLRDKFTVKRFDEKYDDVLPLLSRLVQENSAYLTRIEELSESSISLSPTESISLESLVEYTSPVIKFGHHLKSIFGRIQEKNELSSYLDNLCEKIISESKLTDFEVRILANVMENAKVNKSPAKKDGLLSECLSTFNACVTQHSRIFLV